MVAPADGTSVTQNTGLTRIDASEKIMALCAGGDASLKFLQEMGKTLADSRMLKLKNPQQGAAVLLASICEGTTPFQLMREFHVMDDGGMTMKADAMLAKFIAAGGEHEWVNDGDDGIEAVLKLTWRGKVTESKYTFAQAKIAKLVKPGGGWEKNPGEMLRARATSKGIRMSNPGIISGLYCPEDFEEGGDSPAATPKPKKTTATTVASTANSKIDPDVVDAVIESSAATEEAPFETATTTATTAEPSRDDPTAVLMEIELVLTEIGKTKADIEENMRKKNPAMTTIDDLPLPAAQKLLEQLRVAAAKKRESQAA